MDELSATIRRCELQLKFDNHTEGYGNCFPNAIVQQCRRPEIKTWLQEKRPWAIINNQQILRIKITNFSLNPRNKAIIDLKKNMMKNSIQQIIYHGKVTGMKWQKKGLG